MLGEYLSLRLTSEAAYEYARHGFDRRLGTLKRCTGTSTGRFMIAVLGGLTDVERDLIAPAPPRAAAGRRSAGSTWADPAEIDCGTEGRSAAATGRGCYACRTRAQLRRGKEHDFEASSGMRSNQSQRLHNVTMQIFQSESIRNERSGMQYRLCGRFYMLHLHLTLLHGRNTTQVEIAGLSFIHFHYMCIVGMHVSAKCLVYIFRHFKHSVILTTFEHTNLCAPDFLSRHVRYLIQKVSIYGALEK
jgi:hypothetical protein